MSLRQRLIRRRLSRALYAAYGELGRAPMRTPQMDAWLEVVEHTGDALRALPRALRKSQEASE